MHGLYKWLHCIQIVHAAFMVGAGARVLYSSCSFGFGPLIGGVMTTFLPVPMCAVLLGEVIAAQVGVN
jgi:hypothetical protein